MTKREQFDRIYNSLMNGQKAQAVDQAIEMGLYEIPEMLAYFDGILEQPDIAIEFCKQYFWRVSR